MDPLVSIAIPTIGRIDLLRRSLASARAQTYGAVEILIGDNSDKADVRAAIAVLHARHPELRIVTQLKQLSMASHWNALAGAAKGEYFVVLADDDLLEPNFLTRIMALRKIAPEAEVFFSDHWIIDENDATDERTTEFYSRENGRSALTAGLLSDAPAVVWNSSVPICSSLIKTALIRAFPFNGALNTPELEFFARLIAKGTRFAYAPERLARYRVHSASETQSAGLRYDRLFRALTEIPFPPSATDSRRNLLANLSVTAATDAFLARDFDRVREFMASPLYPSLTRGRPVALLQRACAVLPGAIATPIFKSLYDGLRKLKS
jgi:GT2 family glycosyltransferase